MHAFMHSLKNRYLLSTYNGWGAGLGDEYTAVCETGMVPPFMGLTANEGDRQEMNKPETSTYS